MTGCMVRACICHWQLSEKVTLLLAFLPGHVSLCIAVWLGFFGYAYELFTEVFFAKSVSSFICKTFSGESKSIKG